MKCQQKRIELGLSASSRLRDVLGDCASSSFCAFSTIQLHVHVVQLPRDSPSAVSHVIALCDACHFVAETQFQLIWVSPSGLEPASVSLRVLKVD